MTANTFETTLKKFLSSNKSAMDAALKCSHLAIDHFYHHGDTAYLQRLLEAFTENWNRVAAYKLWMRDFCPVKMTGDGKLSKDQERADVMWADEASKAKVLDAAKAKPFWEYAPAKEQVDFNFETDLIGRLENVIKAAQNTKRFTETSIQANAERFAQAHRLVQALKAGTIAAILPAETPVSQTPKRQPDAKLVPLVGEVPAAA